MKINKTISNRSAIVIQDCLRNIITPEANHLLTEPPGWPKPSGDFGWFCREHAFICSVLCYSLGHPVQLVHGDVSIVQPSKLISTAGHIFKHWWCTSHFVEILDISLNLKHLHSPLLHSPPVIGIGTNASFSVVVAHHKNVNEIPNFLPTIAYSPIETLPHTAEDLVKNPRIFLDTDESSDISARCCIHISRLINGLVGSYTHGFDQSSALEAIRRLYPDARKQIKKLVQSTA